MGEETDERIGWDGRRQPVSDKDYVRAFLLGTMILVLKTEL